MQTIEYRGHVNKEDFPAGPWMGEPDKKQWPDPATKLPCLIVRNAMGALCGYVGVTEGHPLYGKKYGECALPSAKPRGVKPSDDDLRDGLQAGSVKFPPMPQEWLDDIQNKMVCGEEDYCDHRPECLLDAHGGITYSKLASEHTRGQWSKWRRRLRSKEFLKTAAEYPDGDYARALRDAERCGALDSYETWLTDSQATGICIQPDPGESNKLWWFGFDCNHGGDFAPGMYHFEQKYLNKGAERLSPKLTGSVRKFSDGMVYQTYRDFQYVTEQCTALAMQLMVLQPCGSPSSRPRAFDLEE
jgi:hypothetical protein